MCKWFRSRYSLFIHIHIVAYMYVCMNGCVCVCMRAANVHIENSTQTYICYWDFFFTSFVLNNKRAQKIQTSSSLFVKENIYYTISRHKHFIAAQPKTYRIFNFSLPLNLSSTEREKNDIQSVKGIQPIKWLSWIFVWPVRIRPYGLDSWFGNMLFYYYPSNPIAV